MSVRTHGMSYTQVYYVWRTMHTRCENPNFKDYKNYGGRGIKVCERWFSFENFSADMGPRPEGHTIERIDNDGPYSPENCRPTHCPEGHPYAGENLLFRSNGRTYRCRKCHALRERARHRGLTFAEAVAALNKPNGAVA